MIYFMLGLGLGCKFSSKVIFGFTGSVWNRVVLRLGFGSVLRCGARVRFS